MKVKLLGGPKDGRVIDMGDGWGTGRIPPPSFRVMEEYAERNRVWLTTVNYAYYGREGDDTLLYISPGHRVA